MRKHFDFYGYNAPTSGIYHINGEKYFLGEDFRNVKRYKEYKDIGFNMAVILWSNGYNGENWSTSSAKKCFDLCAKVGIKAILEDKRVLELSKEEILLGEDGRFKTEEELASYIDEITAVYRDHPAFYAIQILDEPEYKYLKNQSIIYKVIKKYFPKIEMQSNLLNMILQKNSAPDPEHLQTMQKDYQDYLSYFAKESGINYLMTDEYAFRGSNVLSSWSIPTFQVIANVCRDFGVELRLVLQSFSQEGVCVDDKNPNMVDGSCHWRKISEKEMYWQMNMAMGLGCKEFSFYTYMPSARRNFRTQVSIWDLDGGALLNNDGTRTKLWFATKKIIKEVKEFEPIIINYNYRNSYFFFPEGMDKNSFEFTKEAIVSDVKELPFSVKTTKCPIFVTEMENGGNKMYMIQNIGNPIDESLYKKRVPEIEINLGNIASKAEFYYKGKLVEKKIEGGILKEKLARGQAIFVEVK